LNATPVAGAAAGVIDGRLYVAGGYDGTHLKTLQVYDSATGSWIAETDVMSVARKDAGAAVIDGLLYVAGGYDGSRHAVLEVFDPVSGLWDDTRSPMNTARDGELVALNGKLYAIGGHGEVINSYISTVEVYDPATDVWNYVDSLNEPRWQPVAEVIDGKIFVAGGRNSTGYLNTAEVYDPVTGHWTYVDPMPTARNYASSGVIGGKLFVVGGFDGDSAKRLDVVEIYDPLQNSWVPASELMPTARNGAASGVIDDRLLVFGGVDGTISILDVLEVFDPQEKFIVELASGQVLPQDTELSLGASNVTDYYGNIAAGLFKATFQTAAALLTVTHTGDSGPGSLRQAIIDANNNEGKDLIKFNIPGAGPHTIQPTSSLPIISDSVVIDGFTQPGSSPNTNGAGLGSNAKLTIEIDGSSAGHAMGLEIRGGANTVRGLVIHSFEGSAIYIDGGGSNVIEGCYIGTDPSGMQARPNSGPGAVMVLDSPENTIGGKYPRSRNVISGNGEASDGIHILGPTSIKNTVIGNFLGTDATGKGDLGNGQTGVRLNECGENTVGGASQEYRNIISGNTNGVVLVGLPGNAAARLNRIIGNFVGVDVTGETAIPNDHHGFFISEAHQNTIGGPTAGERNIISGNINEGILLIDNPTQNEILGNYIGTDFGGIDAIPNGVGIIILGAQDNTIGGIGKGLGNLISGNGEGILLRTDANHGPVSGNKIQGNTIGLDANGQPLGNGGNGIRFGGGRPSNNLIGGLDIGAGNLIAFNGGQGVAAKGAIIGGTGNGILSNSIHSNGGLGIDLAHATDPPVTPNDNGADPDSDTGANNLQNYPDLSSASYGPGSITISGSLLSTPESTFTLQFFANTEADPTGYGEGETYLGSTQVTTDEDGLAGFTQTFQISGPDGHHNRRQRSGELERGYS
jgi:N-acetylneuraminic acid mutarotase